MGYSVYNVKSDVFIAGEKKQPALAALLAAFSGTTADTAEPTLGQALAAHGWECSTDDADNIIALYLDGNRLGSEQEKVLAVIAPLVREGSYVMFVGEDSALFGWEFVEVDGVVSAVEREVEPVFVGSAKGAEPAGPAAVP